MSGIGSIFGSSGSIISLGIIIGSYLIGIIFSAFYYLSNGFVIVWCYYLSISFYNPSWIPFFHF